MIALSVSAIVFIVVLVKAGRHQRPEFRRLFWLALTVKLLCGLAVGALYFRYYSAGDTINYWLDARKVYNAILEHPSDAIKFYLDDSETIRSVLHNQAPRSVFFVKIAALIALPVDANYWAMALIASAISFFAGWWMFKELVAWNPSLQTASALALFFIPSFAFWSSGLIKESLGSAAVAAICACLVRWIRCREKWILVPLILAVWIGWNLKYYWLGILMPVLLATVGVLEISPHSKLFTRRPLLMWWCLFLFIVLATTSLHPNFYPSRFAEVIWQSNQEFIAVSDPGKVVHYPWLGPNLEGILLSAPKALIAGLFRPFVWESHHIVDGLAAIENLVLLMFAIVAIRRRPSLTNQPSALLVQAMLVYILLLAVMLALSTPNLGTLSRYKAGFLPFLGILLFSANPLVDRAGRFLVPRQSPCTFVA